MTIVIGTFFTLNVTLHFVI